MILYYVFNQELLMTSIQYFLLVKFHHFTQRKLINVLKLVLDMVKQYSKEKADNIPVVGVINAGVKAALAYQASHQKGAIGALLSCAA